jgi:hypothetical protein
LVNHLIALGVGPESRVGIALERSTELIVSLLAVLKAGGAYVPLDPEYPEERLAYMVRDSGIGLLITDSALGAKLPTEGIQTLELVVFRQWSVVFRQWGVVFRQWGVVFRLWGVVFRLWGVVFRLWGVVFRQWGVVFRQWSVVFRQWGVVFR